MVIKAGCTGLDDGDGGESGDSDRRVLGMKNR